MRLAIFVLQNGKLKYLVSLFVHQLKSYTVVSVFSDFSKNFLVLKMIIFFAEKSPKRVGLVIF